MAHTISKPLADKIVLVTGGTGSFGKTFVRRILGGEAGLPKKIIVLSRDEAKQHYMRLSFLKKGAATDEVIYRNFQNILEFRIGDVRSLPDLKAALPGVHVVVNAAALKQVPTCEYFPAQAVLTNCIGPSNIVQAIQESKEPVETVVGISTDKACKPINAMGMTKAIQERIFISGNVFLPKTRFIGVRYGNVMASRGSVIPLFHEQIRQGGPVTITAKDMTRFLLSLDQAVDTTFAAIAGAERGEIFVPHAPAATVVQVAQALIGDRPIKIEYTGIRPGEKIHEIMVSDEEAPRTEARGNFFAIRPMLPEILSDRPSIPAFTSEYSSSQELLSDQATIDLLKKHRLMIDQNNDFNEEFLR